jgi:hypothetical protein
MPFSLQTARPEAGEFAPYYLTYVAAVPDGDIRATLAVQRGETIAIFSAIPESRADFAYAAGKWTIKELFGHVIDTERVFAYRALRIARNDKTALASFDQDEFVRSGNFSARSLASLVTEYDHVRLATIDLFAQFADDLWSRTGTASNNPVTVRSLAWIIAGHNRHHARILVEKYLG